MAEEIHKEGGKEIMAGGNFDINVGKVRPGSYINVKSKKQQKARGSTRGIAVIPFVG